MFFHYLIPQKLFRLNPKVNWPVHFTSKIIASENIKKGILYNTNYNINNYIQTTNKIKFDSNVKLKPRVKIISSNHKLKNYREHEKENPIIIGNNVWIGANCVILSKVIIGDNVVIGAGSLVTKNIPTNSIAVGNPCKVIKQKEPYAEDLSQLIFNRKIPDEFKEFLK